jgi:hypothetical protein
VQVASSERLGRIAQEDVVIAIANKKRDTFLAQAEKAKAEESVATATEIEKAEPGKRLSISNANLSAVIKNLSLFSSAPRTLCSTEGTSLRERGVAWARETRLQRWSHRTQVSSSAPGAVH